SANARSTDARTSAWNVSRSRTIQMMTSTAIGIVKLISSGNMISSWACDDHATSSAASAATSGTTRSRANQNTAIATAAYHASATTRSGQNVYPNNESIVR